MSYRELTITKQLLTSRIGRIKKMYDIITTTNVTKSAIHRSAMKTIERVVKTNKLYCTICDKEFGENDIGSKIVTSRRASTTIKRWYCVDCAIKKNLLD